MLYALCCMLYAVCFMLYALCFVLYAWCFMLYALCFMIDALCFMLYAVCFMLDVPCFMLYALCFLLNALCFMRFMMVAFWSIFDRFLKLYAWGQPCLTGIRHRGPTWCPTWGLRALKIQFLTNLAPTWGPTWGPKILLYVEIFFQEASGGDPGAILQGIEKGPQDGRHLRSIFYWFWDRLGKPRAPKNSVFVP